MIHLAIVFFIVALVALVLGFGGVAGMSMTFAWWLFAGGILLAVLFYLFRGGFGPPSDPYLP